MISRLIDTLREAAGRELDAREIAEILWLAPFLDASPAGSEPVNAPTPRGSSPGTPSPAAAAPVEARAGEALSPPGVPEPGAPGVDVVLPRPERERGAPVRSGGGMAFRSPGALALPNALQLGRALRPLRRRLVTSRQRELDEVATAERIAREGLWVPVMRPGRSRWLELELVLDTSRSMALWSQTLSELRALLRYHGAFRDVRTWSLVTEGEEGRVRLYRGAGGAANGAPERNPRELLGTHAERRLVLVVSDCVSAGWHSGAVGELLRAWGRSGPVAILQVLPQRVWVRTALRHLPAVWMHGRVPGESNARWVFGPWPGARVASPRGVVPVPAVTLEKASFESWARVVAGRAGAWAPGVLLREGGRARKEAARAPEAVEPLERVRGFDAMASPLAQRLVRLFAAVPLSLPVMRLVWRTRLPEAGQVHLAEVFLGGLLEELPAPGGTADPEQVRYDFVAGVRELLLESLPPAESLDILDGISHYLEERLGRTLDFQAMLADPTAFDGEQLDDALRPFARVAAAVLRRWGGEYEALAERLEGLPPGQGRPGTRARKARPREDSPPAPQGQTRGKRVLVLGTRTETLSEELRQLCALLGRELAARGHSLLSRGLPGVEREVGTAYVGALPARRRPGQEFIQNASLSIDWADVVVLLEGDSDCRVLFQAARAANKPVLPLPMTQGAATQAYQEILGTLSYRWRSGLSRRSLRRLEVPVATPEQARSAVEALLRLLERLHPEARLAPYARAMLDLIRAVEPSLFINRESVGAGGWLAYIYELAREARIRLTELWDSQAKPGELAPALLALRATLPGMTERLLEDFDRCDAMESFSVDGSRLQAQLVPLVLESGGDEGLEAMGNLLEKEPKSYVSEFMVRTVEHARKRFEFPEQFETWLAVHAGVTLEELELKRRFQAVASRLERRYGSVRAVRLEALEAALLEELRRTSLPAGATLAEVRVLRQFLTSVHGDFRATAYLLIREAYLEALLPELVGCVSFESRVPPSKRESPEWELAVHCLFSCLLHRREELVRQGLWPGIQGKLVPFLDGLKRGSHLPEDSALRQRVERLLRYVVGRAPEEPKAPRADTSRRYARALLLLLAAEQPRYFTEDVRPRQRKWNAFLEELVEQAQVSPPRSGTAEWLVRELMSVGSFQLEERPARALALEGLLATLPEMAEHLRADFERLSVLEMYDAIDYHCLALLAPLVARSDGAACLENLQRLARLSTADVERQHTLALALEQVGAVLRVQGNDPGALEAFQAALSIRARLAELEPGNVERQRKLAVEHERLGNLLNAQGQRLGALDSYRAAGAVWERLAGAEPESVPRLQALSRCQDKVGDVLREQRDVRGALVAYASAREFLERLCEWEPGDSQWRSLLCLSHCKMGDVLHEQGNLSAALTAYNAARNSARQLTVREPRSTEWQRLLFSCHVNRGKVLRAQWQLQDSLLAYESARDIARDLVGLEPGNEAWQRELSLSHERVGDALREQEDMRGALVAYESARSLRERLLEQEPENAERQHELGVIHTKVGDVLRVRKELKGALAAYSSALSLAQPLVERDPTKVEWLEHLGTLHHHTGEALREQGDLVGALEAYRSALSVRMQLVTLQPENSRWRDALSRTQSRVDEVLRSSRERS